MLGTLLALLALWTGLAVALAIAITVPVAALLTRVLPPEQRMLPPWVARRLLLLGALLLVVPVGCRSGALAGAVALGDHAAGVPAPPPWPTALLGSREAQADIRAFIVWPTTPGEAAGIGFRLVVGEWWDAWELTSPLLRARAHSADIRSAWWEARPDILDALRRAIAATYIMTFTLLTLGLLGSAFLFLLVRFETPRAHRPADS